MTDAASDCSSDSFVLVSERESEADAYDICDWCSDISQHLELQTTSPVTKDAALMHQETRSAASAAPSQPAAFPQVLKAVALLLFIIAGAVLKLQGSATIQVSVRTAETVLHVRVRETNTVGDLKRRIKQPNADFDLWELMVDDHELRDADTLRLVKGRELTLHKLMRIQLEACDRKYQIRAAAARGNTRRQHRFEQQQCWQQQVSLHMYAIMLCM
jgi:hypothetical protein